MGKTDLKTPWSPTSSRLSGATSAWRNFSYDCFWMLMRFGMSMIFWIFAKLFRVRKLFWTVAGIRSPNDDWDSAGFQKGDAGAPRSRRSPARLWTLAGHALRRGTWAPVHARTPATYLISTVAPAAVSWS